MANNEKRNFYKRNEKTILSFLVVALVLLNIIFMSGLGKTNKSMGDVDTVEVADTVEVDSVETGTLETTKRKHDVSYKFQGNKLVAYIDGNLYETGVYRKEYEHGESGRCVDRLERVIDLDNDGYAEAILHVKFSYGIAMCGIFEAFAYDVLYFDSQSNSFKYVSNNISNLPAFDHDFGELELGQWENGWTLIDRESSLDFSRYVLQNGELTKVGEVHKEVPAKRLASYSLAEMFPDIKETGDEVRTFLECDLNGDGNEDKISLTYSTTTFCFEQACLAISEIRIRHEDFDEEIKQDILIYCNTISILETKTNGMYDLLAGNGDLYQWDGKKYNLVYWDGKRFKVTKN